MPVISQYDFPQDRVAPLDVLRGLREVHPDYTLVHARGPNWWLVRHAPGQVNRPLASAMRATWQAKRARGERIGRDGETRIKQADLALLGYKTVDVYTMQGAPDGRIVADLRQALYHMQATRESDFLAADERAQDAQRDRAHQMLADPDRAKDAHRYLTTSNFGYGVSSVAKPDRVRSGFQRVTPTP